MSGKHRLKGFTFQRHPSAVIMAWHQTSVCLSLSLSGQLLLDMEFTTTNVIVAWIKNELNVKYVECLEKGYLNESIIIISHPQM